MDKFYTLLESLSDFCDYTDEFLEKTNEIIEELSESELDESDKKIIRIALDKSIKKIESTFTNNFIKFMEDGK